MEETYECNVCGIVPCTFIYRFNPGFQISSIDRVKNKKCLIKDYAATKANWKLKG